MTLPEKYDHPLYKHVPDEKSPFAVAWAMVNKQKCVKFPFKFPPLDPKELRAMSFTSVFAILTFSPLERVGASFLFLWLLTTKSSQK